MYYVECPPSIHNQYSKPDPQVGSLLILAAHYNTARAHSSTMTLNDLTVSPGAYMCVCMYIIEYTKGGKCMYDITRIM